jgi:hypothetical protein
MPSDDEPLVPPAEFAFPYEPYGVQRDFMKSLFNTIEVSCSLRWPAPARGSPGLR